MFSICAYKSCSRPLHFLLVLTRHVPRGLSRRNRRCSVPASSHPGEGFRLMYMTPLSPASSVMSPESPRHCSPGTFFYSPHQQLPFGTAWVLPCHLLLWEAVQSPVTAIGRWAKWASSMPAQNLLCLGIIQAVFLFFFLIIWDQQEGSSLFKRVVLNLLAL